MTDIREVLKSSLTALLPGTIGLEYCRFGRTERETTGEGIGWALVAAWLNDALFFGGMAYFPYQVHVQGEPFAVSVIVALEFVAIREACYLPVHYVLRSHRRNQTSRIGDEAPAPIP